MLNFTFTAITYTYQIFTHVRSYMNILYILIVEMPELS